MAEAAPGFDPFEQIEGHSAALADAASKDLDATVPSCPGWDVAALVQHMVEVHWFWASVVELRLSDRADLPERPAAAPRHEVVDVFLAGAAHLVDVLRAADPATHVYTWAPDDETVGFITRHQVQEAAVHHWDAANAVGSSFSMDMRAAADAVDEFLTFSLASTHWPAPAGTEPLGSLVLRSTDTDEAWTVRDAEEAGTISASRTSGAAAPSSDVGSVATVTASATDLLLWLYRRIELPVIGGTGHATARFWAFSSTD